MPLNFENDSRGLSAVDIGSCELHIDGSYCPLNVVYGKVTDKVYKKRDICLVVPNGSASCEKYGLVKEIYLKYPHGDTYTTKNCLTNPCRAAPEDRRRVGDVIMCKPPAYPAVMVPCIANLVMQYGDGVEYENNVIAQ